MMFSKMNERAISFSLLCLLMGAPSFLLAPAQAAVSGADIISDGKASWVGERFQGKKTASGELFDMNDLTASHATLPYGSKVKVISKKTGKSVIVRINNRSEIDNGRIIDLSRRAAEQIGLIEEGVGLVHLDVLQVGAANTVNQATQETKPVSQTSSLNLPANSTDSGVTKYQIQFGSFFDLENAVEFKTELKKKNIETSLDTSPGSNNKTIYRVSSAQKYDTKQQAKDILANYAPQEGVVLPVKEASKVISTAANTKPAKAEVSGNKALPESTKNVEFGAQFGAFETVNNAKDLQTKLLSDKGIRTIIHQFPDDEKRLYRVLTNKPFGSKDEADKFLKDHSLQGIILTFVK